MGFNLAPFPYLSIPSSIVKMEVIDSSETETRRTYGGQQKRIRVFFWGGGNLKKRDRLEDVDIDGKIILNFILMNRMRET